MPLYLAPYIGVGSRAEPYRPRGSDQRGWKAIDLRPDGSTPAGYALLLLPAHDPDPLLRRLADDPEEKFGAVSKAEAQTRLLLTEDIGDVKKLAQLILFGDKRANLCKPCSWSWKGEREIVLGPHRLGLQTGGPRNPLTVDPTDNFNRANETPLAGNWTKTGGSSSGTINLSSNQIVRAGTSNNVGYYWNADTPPDDQWCEFDFISAVDSGPACRSSTSALTFYFASIYTGPGGPFPVSKLVAGAHTALDTSSWGTLSSGDVIRIEAEGSTVRAKKNGSLIGSATDTEITAGRWGIQAWENGDTWDNWQGGDFAAGHTGTGVLSLSGLTIAGAGAEKFTGAGALALTATALSAQGVMAPSGAGAIDLSQAALAGTGIEEFPGAGQIALSGAIVAGQALETFAGSGALPLSGASLSGTGVMHPAGTGALVLSPAALAAQGAEEFLATSQIILSSAAIAASGTHTTGTAGSGVLALLAARIAALGEQGIPGAGAIVLDGVVLAGSGEQSFPGAGAVTLSPATLAALGLQQLRGAGAIVLSPASLAALGLQQLRAAGAILLLPAGLAAAGALPLAGAGALVLDGVALAGLSAPLVGALVCGELQLYVLLKAAAIILDPRVAAAVPAPAPRVGGTPSLREC